MTSPKTLIRARGRAIICDSYFIMSVENRMNEVLGRLGLSGWAVQWTPNSLKSVHGEVSPEDQTVRIYDAEVDEAWLTLHHELIELTLRTHLKHRIAFENLLLNFIENILYEHKERSIEKITEISRAIVKARRKLAESVDDTSTYMQTKRYKFG